jgi:dTDP-4-amino-4,6-dideoxygalactose transaminase
VIPRIRPVFSPEYLSAFRTYDPRKSRQQIAQRLSNLLRSAYPSAKGFEFFDEGRKSLAIALEVIGAHPGDEVILSAFTCPSVLEPICGMGLSPVPVDPQFNFTLEPDAVKKGISPRTKAIIVSHLFGIPTNASEILEIAEHKGIPVIEDCAHIFCATTKRGIPGSFGDMAFTSHKNGKPLSLGRGSTLIVNNEDFLPHLEQVTSQKHPTPFHEEQAAFLSLLHFFLQTDPVRYTSFIGTGENFFYFLAHPAERETMVRRVMDESTTLESLEGWQPRRSRRAVLQNLIGRAVGMVARAPRVEPCSSPRLMQSLSLHILAESLQGIHGANARRRTLGNLYSSNLEDPRLLHMPYELDTPCLQFPLICDDFALTSKIGAALRVAGFEVGNFNWSESISGILYPKKASDRATYIAKTILNLPCYPYLSEESVIGICSIINEHLNSP